MAAGSGPALPGLHAGAGGVPVPRRLERGLLRHPAALRPHRGLPGRAGRALRAAGLRLLRQGQDPPAAPRGEPRLLQRLPLPGLRVPDGGGLGRGRGGVGGGGEEEEEEEESGRGWGRSGVGGCKAGRRQDLSTRPLLQLSQTSP